MTTPQRKKPAKRMRGIPAHYDVAKKRRTLWLTQPAWEYLKQLAEKEGESTAEYVEKWIRNMMANS